MEAAHQWILDLGAEYGVNPYPYLAIMGRNIPVWVWIFLAVLLSYGAWSAIRDTRCRIAAARAAESD